MPNDIGSTLKSCRNSAKMSVKEISDFLTSKGFKASESTIYSWENGNSQPTPGALLTMCIAYGIEDVLSTFGYDGYNSDGSIQLTLNESELISKYRDLDDHGKDMVDTVLDKEWARSTSNQKAEPPYIKIMAAHNDKALEDGELEKMQSDIDMLDSLPDK